MSRFASIAAIAMCAATCNARSIDFADFDNLPLLGREVNDRWDGNLTITKYHKNAVTNGVTRNWLEFHVRACHGAIPDATNVTVMCCETVKPEFRGSDEEWRKLPHDERTVYSRVRMLTPWRSLPEAEVLKLREEYVYDGMCLMCSGGDRHAFYSATVDTADSLGDYGGFSHGFAFYVVAECFTDE